MLYPNIIKTKFYDNKPVVNNITWKFLAFKIILVRNIKIVIMNICMFFFYKRDQGYNNYIIIDIIISNNTH